MTVDPQHLGIVKYLVHETPIGHLKSTIENLKVILGLDLLEVAEIKSEISRYDELHLRQVNFLDDKILLSSINKDSEGYYHDQNKNLKILVSPINENIDKVEKYTPDECPFRSMLYSRLLNYREQNYKLPLTAINGKIISLFLSSKFLKQVTQILTMFYYQHTTTTSKTLGVENGSAHGKSRQVEAN